MSDSVNYFGLSVQYRLVEQAHSDDPSLVQRSLVVYLKFSHVFSILTDIDLCYNWA